MSLGGLGDTHRSKLADRSMAYRLSLPCICRDSIEAGNLSLSPSNRGNTSGQRGVHREHTRKFGYVARLADARVVSSFDCSGTLEKLATSHGWVLKHTFHLS